MPPKGARHKKRSAFTPEEDDRLKELVEKHGENNWFHIASKMPKRDTRQCRERWFNYLSPRVINGVWTKEEEELLAEKVAIYGRKWKTMEPFFPGRTDINIKNRWNFLQKRKAREEMKTVFDEKQMDDFFESLMTSEAGCSIDRWPEFGFDMLDRL